MHCLFVNNKEYNIAKENTLSLKFKNVYVMVKVINSVNLVNFREFIA